jgi:hypothetical protein
MNGQLRFHAQCPSIQIQTFTIYSSGAKLIHALCWGRCSRSRLLSHTAAKSVPLTVSSVGNLSEAPAVKVLDGLADLRIGVHDEWSIARDRLIDGFPSQH